ncbi:disease resistance protein [Striga asiatica]|uniref:Disease resistance protein n=1 Tax=Striga asiatica TaxID=4170 RepID=A0A5A7QGX3_STRAF|nr:disease resistance protein [Striga asiatica]
MAAAYAALLSLRHTIEQLRNHPDPSVISLYHTQIESISENIIFLLQLLEKCTWPDSAEEADALEARLADTAYEAEDLVESHTATHRQIFNPIHFFRFVLKASSLAKVAEDMDSITNCVKEMMTEINDDDVEEELHKNRTAALTGSSSRYLPNSKIMVGVDDVIVQVMGKLTDKEWRPKRHIIPIVGMGGSEYSIRDILVQCLLSLQQEEDLNGKCENVLGELLYKSLSGRRYLVVMDDLWSVEAWEKMQFYFPDYADGSRIVITTRLTRVALYMANSVDVVEMKFLDEDNSWNLFCKFLDEDNSWNLFCRIVFEEESCPPELEETGKKIVKSCRGLPLSITVIGGLLSKVKQSRRYWENVLKNFHAVLNSEDDECCSRILRLSYFELPIYLKPCFIYMGVFREDRVIPKSRLVRLLVAEGILRPISGKSLEIVAEEYLQELVDRNLVLVEQFGSTGNIKSFKIHDLLRDLCVKEARKKKFLHVLESPRNEYFALKTQRRTSFYSNVIGDHYINSWRSSSLRSLICDLRKGAIELRNLYFKSLRALTVVYAAHLVPEENDDFMKIIPYLRLLDIDCEKFPLAPCPPRETRPSKLGWSLGVSFSLKKLSLWCMKSDWEEIGTTIGLLPHLQVLKLIYCHLGHKWVTVEGQFQLLKYLHVSCQDLLQWSLDSCHFPCLEHLVLDTFSKLDRIPREVGDMPMLKSIVVRDCNESTMASAREIEREQREDIGNESLRVTIVSRDYDKSRQEFSIERLEVRPVDFFMLLLNMMTFLFTLCLTSTIRQRINEYLMNSKYQNYR